MTLSRSVRRNVEEYREHGVERRQGYRFQNSLIRKIKYLFFALFFLCTVIFVNALLALTIIHIFEVDAYVLWKKPSGTWPWIIL